MWQSRILSITAGAPQTGKTFLIETMCSYVTKKTGKPTLVYNRGKPADYQKFEKLDFLTVEETAFLLAKKKKRTDLYLERPRILFFRYAGKVYQIDDFVTVCRGKLLAMRRHEDENLLFRAINQKMGGIQLIIDDAKTIFRHGLSKEAISLFDRLNHAGDQNKNGIIGMDCHVMFHSLDAVNETIYDYATHIFLVKSVNIPDLSKLKIPGLNEAIKKAYTELKQAEKYTAYQVEILSDDPTQFIKITPQKTLSIRKSL